MKLIEPCSPDHLRTMYESGMTQAEIGAHLGVGQHVIFNAMKRHGITARTAAKRNQWGEMNARWKGGEASKQAFHRRLYARYGKPIKCGKCGTESAKHYDYANLTGRYQDLSDYMPMCRSCHWKYDQKHLNFGGVKEVTNARA